MFMVEEYAMFVQYNLKRTEIGINTEPSRQVGTHAMRLQRYYVNNRLNLNSVCLIVWCYLSGFKSST